MWKACFKCSVCAFTTLVEIEKGKQKNLQCVHIAHKYSSTLIHNLSHFSDKQMIKTPHTTPHTTVLFAHNNLIDAVMPADRVSITGFL